MDRIWTSQLFAKEEIFADLEFLPTVTCLALMPMLLRMMELICSLTITLWVEKLLELPHLAPMETKLYALMQTGRAAELAKTI